MRNESYFKSEDCKDIFCLRDKLQNKVFYSLKLYSFTNSAINEIKFNELSRLLLLPKKLEENFLFKNELVNNADATDLGGRFFS